MTCGPVVSTRWAPTRLDADPLAVAMGPSARGSRRHRYALDEHERLFDPRRLR
jgi:hypothetical protein